MFQLLDAADGSELVFSEGAFIHNLNVLPPGRVGILVFLLPGEFLDNVKIGAQHLDIAAEGLLLARL